MNSPHKGQWHRALIFSLICVWINGWVNNREAGDLRRYRAHYDATVMNIRLRECIIYCLASQSIAEELLYLTHLPPGQNGRHWADDISNAFCWQEKLCILIRISMKFVLRGPIYISSDNGLAPNRRHVITLTNADPVYRRIHAARGGDDLMIALYVPMCKNISFQSNEPSFNDIITTDCHCIQASKSFTPLCLVGLTRAALKNNYFIQMCLEIGCKRRHYPINVCFLINSNCLCRSRRILPCITK